MENAGYEFKPAPFVQAGFETARGRFSDEERQELSTIRYFHPELNHWGDMAVHAAWADYSEDVYLVSWADWGADGRDENFLNYCWWRQERGAWRDELDLEKLAQAGPFGPIKQNQEGKID